MIETSKSCHFNHSDSAVWLVDNGSLRSQSILALRAQAASLAELAGVAVEPVSVLHSAKVPPEQLGGCPAVTFTPFLRASAAKGLRRLLVVPYFFGPSAALTDYLPQQIARVQEDFPHLQVRIAPPLVDMGQPLDDAPQVLAGLLAKEIDTLLEQAGGQTDEAAAGELGSVNIPTPSAVQGGGAKALQARSGKAVQSRDASVLRLPAAVMVDHGSPQSAVSAVRDCVGQHLGQLLAGSVAAFAVCSMEAREGAEYAHTLPLLEEVLGRQPFCNGRVIVAPLFLGPGRHAGQGGDLWQIAERVREVHPSLEVTFCQLPGASPEVTRLLLRRLRASMEALSI